MVNQTPWDVVHRLPLADGRTLALRRWPTSGERRGVVLLAHGLGEHVGRYAHVAAWLSARGFEVLGHDQHGHGASPGKRGALDRPTRLQDDLAEVAALTRREMAEAEPLVLLGHSLGGLVAASTVASRRIVPDALVLSSPALASGMRADQRWLAMLLDRIAPDATTANGLDTSRISHDPAEVAAYRADRQVHDRISGRLAHFIAASGPPTIAASAGWSVPTLLMFAGDDHLVDAEGSRRFGALAPPGVVEAREFPGLYHELFNEREPDRSAVFDVLRNWLEVMFPSERGSARAS